MSPLESQCAAVLQLSVSDDVIVHVSSPRESSTSPNARRTSSGRQEVFGLASTTRLDNDEQLRTSTSSNEVVYDADPGIPDKVVDSVSSAGKTVLSSTDGTKQQTSTVREVVYDEHGQTWDVYGADFDPEILGQAIQTYLEKIMRKKMMQKTGVEASECVDGSRDSCLCETKNSAAGRRSSRQFDRFVAFIMRYLCSSVRWRARRSPAGKTS